MASLVHRRIKSEPRPGQSFATLSLATSIKEVAMYTLQPARDGPAAEPADDTTVFDVGPQLDFHNVAAFRSRCDSFLREGKKNFVLDLSRLGILDSTGLGAIYNLYRSIAPAHGRILILTPSPFALSILKLTRSHRIFRICPTLESA